MIFNDANFSETEFLRGFMKDSELGRFATARKEHYKMYKAGKRWLFAGIALLFLARE